MNLFDALIILIVGISFLLGIRKGLVHEIFALVGVFLGILIALIVSPKLAPVLEGWIPFESASYAVSFLLVFVATMLLTAMVANVLTKTLNIAHLGFYNRLLGGAFGLARGVIIGLIVTLGLALFLEPDSTLLTESRVTPRLAWGARALAPLLPEGIREILLDRLDRLPGDAEEIV